MNNYAHRDKALKMEKEALYEQAGDEWVQQAPIDKNYSTRVKDLTYAAHNYTKAMRSVKLNSKDEDRLWKKFRSVDKGKRTLRPTGKIGLVGKMSLAVLSIISLLGALSSTAFSVTGNAVGGIQAANLKWIGLCFFVCGLVFTFIYLKKKVKKF